MAKWKSPLFSDIRNKLGESAVFSMWKGRPYFRSYVVPANPNTTKQSSNRDELRDLVARWQAIIDDADKKAVWNSAALPYAISGYNLFTKYGRKSEISVPATASGSGSATVTVTYTSGIPVAHARIFTFDGTNWDDVTPAEGLESGADKTADITIATSGTYEFYLAYDSVLVDGDSAPQDYQAITKWKPNTTSGVADEAKCVVTVS